ncbi:MAG: tetratricopeptide repeat protein [Planctomycetota bacterium]
MIALWGCAAAHAALAQERAPAAGAKVRSEVAPLPAPQAPALARTVAALPRAAPGAWHAWHDAPVPDLYRAALAAYRSSDIVAAWGLAFECLDALPDYPAALSLVGGLAFRLRRHEDAISAFERFLEHSPEDVARTRHLGHAYHSVGRHADACAHYTRVLAAPDITADAAREARFGRALAEYRMGEVERSRADLEAVLAEAPSDVDALTWLATLDFEDEALVSARERAERAAALAPFDPRPVFLIARVIEEELALLDAPPGDHAASSVGNAADEGRGAGGSQDAATRSALMAQRAEVQARFARLSAADARSRELEATLMLRPGELAARIELTRVRALIEDGAGALRQAAILARTERAPDAQLLVLEVLERFGRPESAGAHASLLEGAFQDDPAVLEALSAFHARRNDQQGQLRCGARAAELRAR